jgi:putative transposase
MIRRQAFKFELMPTANQQCAMRCFAGARRFVFNKALALQNERHANGLKYIAYVPMAKLLTQWRHSEETPWLKEAPVHPLQHALKDLERAFQNFFAKRASYPRFCKRGEHDSFRYPDPKQIKLDQGNARICLPKLGWLRYRKSRAVLGMVKQVTVCASGGKWFVAIQTEREVNDPLPQGTTAIGIDLGIVHFAALSNGKFIEPLDSFRRHEDRLRKAQRAMSRKVKFSANWKKAKARVQRLYARIANARRDFLHKQSTAICKNHALVCIEDLQVRNMSKSAAGSREFPGRQVRAKSGLNKAILDQGWSEFRRQLTYKAAWQGDVLVAVSPQNTSRTCPCCGHVSADNRRSQAKFACTACKYEDHADVVGARNILARGIRVIACGTAAQSGPAMKQEPTGALEALQFAASADGIPFLSA